MAASTQALIDAFAAGAP
ncbi:hypothetical protein Tco_1549055, partial [Tanacetum coccineum]